MNGIFCCFALLALCCVSCRKELCYDHNMGVPVTVTFDWEGVGVKPEGMRIIFYPLDHGENPIEDNLPADGGVVRVLPGRYAVVMFNNDSETILIRGEERFETIEAYTRTLMVVDPPTPVKAGERQVSVVNRPDRLFGVSISELMVGDAKKSNTGLAVKPVALVSQYSLRQALIGGESVRQVRGGVSGVCPSIMLGTQRPAEGGAVVVADCAHPQIDSVVVIFNCFGCVTPETVTSKPLTLAIELTMPDASVKYGYTDVSEAVATSVPSDPTTPPPPPTVIDKPIEVDYIPSVPGGSGGMDVGVDDWENVERPL